MVDPEVWGPSAWKFLHTITFNYPNCPSKNDKDRFKNLFNLLEFVLPCDKCKDNFVDHIKKRPLTDKILCSKRDFIKWLIDVHNDVNKMNGKPSISYNDAIYDILYKNDNQNLLICILIAIIIFLLMILFGILIFWRK